VDSKHSEKHKSDKKDETAEYQGQRALWVLSTFCGGIVGNMANCQAHLDKYNKGDDKSSNNLVAVQKMAYGSCLNLLTKLKKDYDNDHA